MKMGEKLHSIIKEVYPYISLAEFARRAGVKKTTMHDIIKKENLDKVEIGNFKRIANTMGMTIDELIERLEY